VSRDVQHVVDAAHDREVAGVAVAHRAVAGEVERAAELEDKAWCNGESYSLADIATGCALGYLDLRLPGFDWRGTYENLARHAEKLAKRASFADTAPAAS
jgi:glutathione S-transferase